MSGERLRIVARLVHTADGSQMWSQRFDCRMDDIFEVQEQIASAVVTALGASLQKPGEPSGAARRPVHNVSAYTKYLKARQTMTRQDLLEEARIIRRRPPEEWPESIRHGLIVPQLYLLVRNHGTHPDHALALVVDAIRKGARTFMAAHRDGEIDAPLPDLGESLGSPAPL